MLLSNTNCMGPHTINAANIGSYDGSVYRMRSLAVCVTHLCIFGPKVFLDPICCVLKVWYWPCVWVFRLALTGHIQHFLPFETPTLTLCLLLPRDTWCGSACFGARVSSKYGSWYCKRVILQFMYVGCWGALHIFATHCWPAPKRAKQLSTVAILQYRSLPCWCLETFFM